MSLKRLNRRPGAAIGIDAVTLRVGDLERMSAYYSNALAMEPLEEVSRGSEIHRVLGRGATPLVKLVATPNLPGVDRTQAGLFHTAFLFENQASLAATVAHAAQNTNSQFVGSSATSICRSATCRPLASSTSTPSTSSRRSPQCPVSSSPRPVDATTLR